MHKEINTFSSYKLKGTKRAFFVHLFWKQRYNTNRIVCKFLMH